MSGEDAVVAIEEFGEGLARDAEPFGCGRDREAQRFEIHLAEDFAGVRRIVHVHSCTLSSVIIDEVDIGCVFTVEGEHDSPVS